MKNKIIFFYIFLIGVMFTGCDKNNSTAIENNNKPSLRYIDEINLGIGHNEICEKVMSVIDDKCGQGMELTSELIDEVFLSLYENVSKEELIDVQKRTDFILQNGLMPFKLFEMKLGHNKDYAGLAPYFYDFDIIFTDFFNNMNGNFDEKKREEILIKYIDNISILQKKIIEDKELSEDERYLICSILDIAYHSPIFWNEYVLKHNKQKTLWWGSIDFRSRTTVAFLGDVLVAQDIASYIVEQGGTIKDLDREEPGIIRQSARGSVGYLLQLHRLD